MAAGGVGVAAPSATRGDAVTLTATNAAGTSGFNSATGWSNAIAPAAGNTYTVGTGLQLRTPFDTATDLTFAGDSLTLAGTTASNAQLVIKNLTNTTVTVNNLTFDGGQLQNGGTSAGAATAVTLAGNAITLGTAGGAFNSGAAGRTLTVTAPVGGTGPLSFTGGGLVVLGAASNAYVGNTTISGGTVLRAIDGTQLSLGGNLSVGGVFETSADVTRAVGTDVGQVQVTNAVAGFSARGGNVVVALGGTAAPTALTWGAATFNPSVLTLNAASATNALEFRNDLDLGTGTVERLVSAGANTVTVSGRLTGTAPIKYYGAGTVVLTNPLNATTGTTTISEFLAGRESGVVRAAASGVFGTGTVTVGSNGALGRLELAGNSTQANAIALPARTTTAVEIQSVAGANTLGGLLTLGTGGTFYTIQSDAGSTLTLSGTVTGTAMTSGATGARTVTLQGAGNGVVSGPVANGAGTVGITKAGIGTWTLSATNAYTGTTTASAGTLLVNGSVAGPAAVAAGATLGGTGSITGPLTVASSGVVSPGVGGIGTLTDAGAATVAGTLRVEFNAAATAAPIDRLIVGGALDIASATVDFDDLNPAVPLGGTAYVLATYGSLAGSAFAAVTDLPTGYGINYAYNGNSIALVPAAVPEPATAVAAGVAVVGLLAGRRRRAWK